MRKVQPKAAQLLNKGEGILITGPTGPGRTTSLSALAKAGLSECYARIGEGLRKGSLNDKQYSVTDHPDIPADTKLTDTHVTVHYLQLDKASGRISETIRSIPTDGFKEV